MRSSLKSKVKFSEGGRLTVSDTAEFYFMTHLEKDELIVPGPVCAFILAERPWQRSECDSGVWLPSLDHRAVFPSLLDTSLWVPWASPCTVSIPVLTPWILLGMPILLRLCWSKLLHFLKGNSRLPSRSHIWFFPALSHPMLFLPLLLYNSLLMLILLCLLLHN